MNPVPITREWRSKVLGTQFVVEETFTGCQYDFIVFPFRDVIDEGGVAFLFETNVSGVDAFDFVEMFGEDNDTGAVAAPQLVVNEAHVHLDIFHSLLVHLLPRHARLARTRAATRAARALPLRHSRNRLKSHDPLRNDSIYNQAN